MPWTGLWLQHTNIDEARGRPSWPKDIVETGWKNRGDVDEIYSERKSSDN